MTGGVKSRKHGVQAHCKVIIIFDSRVNIVISIVNFAVDSKRASHLTILKNVVDFKKLNEVASAINLLFFLQFYFLTYPTAFILKYI